MTNPPFWHRVLWKPKVRVWGCFNLLEFETFLKFSTKETLDPIAVSTFLSNTLQTLREPRDRTNVLVNRETLGPSSSPEMTMPPTPLTAIAQTPRKELESKFTFNPMLAKVRVPSYSFDCRDPQTWRRIHLSLHLRE
ncbi:hypothetical protein K0M31_017407 [Melipona bicolor]|uniref:Uncharacterized protein n=1 Tax=Melipona bicolor TaxID=60889 RepID=A0AA40KSM7_9HYME|nr:hypothetical protein K0M31_017407 [Melipona bicolor]